MVPRAGLGLLTVGFRMCASEQPPRSLSMGRRRSTRAYRPRAVPRYARWSRPPTLEGRRTREEYSLVRFKTVVPRAGLGLAHRRFVCACAHTRAHASAPLRSLSMGRRRITRACSARLRRAHTAPHGLKLPPRLSKAAALASSQSLGPLFVCLFYFLF